MSCQQNQQQCQPPPKCQTPKCPPQAPSPLPITSGCGSSSGGCSSAGSESGCCLFSHHHRRSHLCRHRNSDHCDSGSGFNQQSGNCDGNSGGCC